MSGTRRKPLARRSAVQITPRALDLYTAMGKLRCTCPPRPPEYWKHKMCAGCERWYDLHGELNDELRCESWEWPCVGRVSRKRAGSTCWNEDIAARMAALNAAVRQRRAERTETGTIVPVTMTPSLEEDIDANPVASEDTNA